MDKVEFLKRALTDVAFRKTLESSPEKILGPDYTKADIESIQKVLSRVKRIDSNIESMATDLLCYTGPCGIA
jgi:hypothetical protein